MSESNYDYPLTKLAIAIAAICIPITVWIAKSGAEAAAYTRVTGHEVSTWDAMFLQLRVDGAPRKDGAVR